MTPRGCRAARHDARPNQRPICGTRNAVILGQRVDMEVLEGVALPTRHVARAPIRPRVVAVRYDPRREACADKGATEEDLDEALLQCNGHLLRAACVSIRYLDGCHVTQRRHVHVRSREQLRHCLVCGVDKHVRECGTCRRDKRGPCLLDERSKVLPRVRKIDERLERTRMTCRSG